MIFPTNEDELRKVVTYLVERCLSTREDRDRLYQWREKYYLFGTQGYEQSKYNKLASHIDLVTSFLYAPDHAFFHIAADPNEDDLDVLKATALQDDFDDDFQGGMSDDVMEAIKWSLVYEMMIPKVGWNRDVGHLFLELVPPHNFGVYRDSITDINSQEAFCHTYFMDYQKACGKLMLSGHEDWIPRIKVTHTDAVSPFPQMLQRMIIAGTGGSNLAGTIFGQVNPDYSPSATYQPKSEVPLVRFTELWAWDDSCLDWRTFHLLEPDLLIGDSKLTVEAYNKATRNVHYLFGRLPPEKRSLCNIFYPGEHPFRPIIPYGKHNYFWGVAHLDALVPLQEWYLERLDQIADILERQAYPPRVGSGFMGLSEEKMAAFGGADTYLFDQLPQAKMEELHPEMPADMFAEVREISNLFLEASGLTEVMAGRSEQGVRSRQHASELKKSGSGRIKKAALAIESPIAGIGDIALKLKMAHDEKLLKAGPDENDKVHPFHPWELHGKALRMRVDGHSHSPLFGDEARDLAFIMRRLGVIDNEDTIRMLNPPSRDNLLHRLHKRERQQRQMVKQLKQTDPQAAAQLISGSQRGGGHKKK